MTNTVTKMATMEDHFLIEQFLYNEARLLDERKFDDWMTCIDDEVRYYIPNRYVRKPESRDDKWDIEDELSKDVDLALLSDNKLTLFAKIMRLQGGLSFSETPPSRTTRLITNVQVALTDTENIYQVRSNFHVNRTRAERDEHNFIGSRRDLWKRNGDKFVLIERRIVLNCTVMSSPNLSIFL